MTDQTETVTAKPLKSVPQPKTRSWSVTTLAQHLRVYVGEKGIGKDDSVGDLFESLKAAIVAQAVGTSLDL